MSRHRWVTALTGAVLLAGLQGCGVRPQENPRPIDPDSLPAELDGVRETPEEP